MAYFLSRLDYQRVGRNYIISRNPKIDPAQVDIQGSDVNIFVGTAAHMTHFASLQFGFQLSRHTLEGAFGEDLERHAWDKYQLPLKGASAAVGEVRFYRENTNAGAGTIPIGTKLGTLTGIEYITTSEASFTVGDLFATCEVRATQAGKTSQVGRNNIRKILSLPNGSVLFDTTLKVNNDDPTAGGEPRESDPQFKLRIRQFWKAQRRGVLSAIEQGALTVAGVISAKAFETTNYAGYAARIVQLHIADSSGVASRQLANAVQVALMEYRAGGIQVVVNTSLPQIVSIQLSLRFGSRVDTVKVSSLVRASVVEYVNSLPANATLYRQELGGMLNRFRSYGLVLHNGIIVAPSGDLVPAVGQTIRTTLSNVTTV